MSGVVKAVGKVFKGVAKAVTGAVKWVAHNWQYVALAAAAVYTGGLAMGAWGAAGGAAATAGEAGAVAADIGGGAAAAGGAMTAGEAAAAMATPGLEGLGVGAATVGASADIGAAAMMATPGLEALGAGSAAASGGELGSGAFSGLLANAVTQGPASAMTQATSSWWDPNKSFMGNVSSDATHAVKAAGNYIFGGGSSAGGTAAGSSGGVGGLLGSYAKMQLLSTGLQTVGAYMMNKPRPPSNYSGRTPGGGGGGIGMHTVNGGFGLAAGGTEPAPSGVPNALIPNNTPWGGNAGGTAPGASLSDQGLKSAASQPGNVGQAVANQVGVGGLIPQGAVNYMGGGGNG